VKVFLCYLQRRNQLHYLARHIPCCSGVWMRLPNTSQRPGGNSCDSRSEIGCASSTSSLSPGEALSILASRSTSRRRQHVYCPLAQALHQQLQLPPGIVLAPATHYFRAREWCSQRHEIAPHAPACPVPSAGLLAAAMCATLRLEDMNIRQQLSDMHPRAHCLHDQEHVQLTVRNQWLSTSPFDKRFLWNVIFSPLAFNGLCPNQVV